MKKIYLVVRGSVNNEETCDIYTIRCGCNEFNVYKNMMKNYQNIIQIFAFTTYKEAQSVKRSIDEIIKGVVK